MERKNQVVDALLSKIVVGTEEFAYVFMYIYIMVLCVFFPMKPLSTLAFGLMLTMYQSLCVCSLLEDWRTEKESWFRCSLFISSG